jgi:hypothetical protein
MMKYLPQLLAMVVAGFLSMSLSIRLGWSKKLWSVINRRLNPIYNATVWILFAAFLHITIQWICASMGINNTRLITGAAIGLYLGLIPNLRNPWKKNQG